MSKPKFLAEALQTPFTGPSGITFVVEEATQDALNTECPDVVEEGANVNGIYSRRSGTIRLLYDNRAAQAVAHVFVHECLHDVVYAAGEEQNEALVTTLTDVVFDVLAGSPAFRWWCTWPQTDASRCWGLPVKVSGRVWMLYRSSDGEIEVGHGAQEIYVPEVGDHVAQRALVWEGLLQALYESGRLASSMHYEDTRSAVALHIARMLFDNAGLWQEVFAAPGVVLDAPTPPTPAAADPFAFYEYRKNFYVLGRVRSAARWTRHELEDGQRLQKLFEDDVWKAYDALAFPSERDAVTVCQEHAPRFTLADVLEHGWGLTKGEG